MASSASSSVRSKADELQGDTSGVISLDAPVSVTSHNDAALAAEGGTGTMAEAEPTAATTTTVRAALQEIANDAEGREELAAFATALREEGGVKAALEHPRPHRKMVAVILSAEDPMRVDSRDTLARRMGGEALSDALFGITRSTAFSVWAVGIWIAMCIALAGSLLKAIPANLALVIWTACAVTIGLFAATQFSVPVLWRLTRRFDFWFLLGHVAAAGAGGSVLFDDKALGVTWLLFSATYPFTMCFDSVARRSRTTTAVYVVGEMIVIFLLAGLFFRKFPVRTVLIRVFSSDISINDRTYSSLVTFAIYVARFLATSFIDPTCLVILSDLRSVKVPGRAAGQIFKAYSLQNRHIEAAAREASRGAATVAPAEQPRRALEDVAAAALDATGGDDAAARKLLLGMLDELAGALSEVRRSTVILQREITIRWGRAGGDNDGFGRILLPRFIPVVVDSSRTIAAALGGPRLNDLCYRVCRSPAYSALTLLVILLGYACFGYTLSSHDNVMIPVWYAMMLMAFVSNQFQTMLLNTEVLAKIVLRRWDTYWSLANVYTVALAGAFIFKDAAHGVAWALSQVMMSSYFLRDAAPPSKTARRIDSLNLALYASFHCYSVFAIWLRLYDVQDYFIDVLGMPVNLRHWCFAAQVNAAIIATRFAVRALSDQRNLMFAAGLIRVRMPAADARELRALMQAEREVRSVSSVGPRVRRPPPP